MNKKANNLSHQKISKNTISFIPLLVMIIITVSACGRSSAPSRGRRPTREDVAIPVITEKVQKRDLAEYINITGRLEGITDVTVISETSGRVLSLAKQLGEWIEEGEEIGSLDNEVYRIRLDQAKAGLASATAALETAAMNYRSSRQLFDKGSVSQGEYQQALFAHQAAVAQRDGAAANLSSSQKAFDNSRLIAPVSGYITSLNLKVGETIFPNVPLAGIVNHKSLLLKGGVTESVILAVKPDQSVIINHNGKEYPGKVRGVGIKPVPNTASYPIEIIMENLKGELIPGMVVNARIKTYEHRNVIYTDDAHIRTRFDDDYVFTVGKEEKAIITKVTLGRKVNEFTIITGGLEVGSLLIVEGIDSLEDGISVNIRNVHDYDNEDTREDD